MLPYEEAISRVLTRVPVVGSESVPVADALRRVLLEDVVAAASMPAADTSAMDGYAIAHASLSGTPPFVLPVRGESRAGAPSTLAVGRGACRIFTGALLPDGADTVVIQENTERLEEGVRILTRPKRGDNVRQRGEDVAAGSIVLERGTLLNPFRVSLLAAIDCTHVEVSRRPRVGILCTGSELRRAGTQGPPGSIAESNSVAIAGLAHRAGAHPLPSVLVPDDLEQTRVSITRLLDQCDVLVSVGGVSVGEHDVVKRALEEASVELDFWKVRIKPGKPLVFGHHERCVVLGLPGNPVSAQLTFCLFGLPLLAAMQGRSRVDVPTRRLRLAEAITQVPGRRGYHRVMIRQEEVVPLSNQGSGNVASMALADGVAIVAEDLARLDAGAAVDVICFSELV